MPAKRGRITRNGMGMAVRTQWKAPPSYTGTSEPVRREFIQRPPTGAEVRGLASAMLDWLPGVGDIKAVQESVTGRDVITGKRLGAVQRLLSGLAVLPFVPGTIRRLPQKLRIYLRPEDLVPIDDAWSGFKGYRVRGSGDMLKGELLDASGMPELLYHVTTAKRAVLKSGALRSMHDVKEARGLGKGVGPAHQGVSFTTNRATAEHIKRSVLRNIEIARAPETLPQRLVRYAREDEIAAGLPRGALDEAVESALSDYRMRTAGGETGAEAAKTSLDIYRWAAEGLGGPENPIIFGSADEWRRVDPEDVDILTVHRLNK